ncbi:alpha-L-fucosidase [Cohnella cholangitidis]|nr:alpha-L-fucosidase [Cohnella cholangitidis]
MTSLSMQDIQRHKEEIKRTIRGGPFADDWDSLGGYEIPSWYEEGKFGIFIHWGVYSVPAFENEWYPRNMYRKDSNAYLHHLKTYGPPDQFGYKDFIPKFQAQSFDADEWAALFKRAGANFIVPVAEHHDGFAMYDCPFTSWNSCNMGPKRDIIRELSEAVRKRFMTFGVSSHRAENWWFYNGGRDIPSDIEDSEFVGLYGPAQRSLGRIDTPAPLFQPSQSFLDDWLVRTCHLIDRYGPQLVYFDWWIEQPAFQPYLRRLAAYYYNRAAEWDQGVVINYKFNAFKEGTAVYDMERGLLDRIQPRVWQTCTSVSETAWCHIEGHVYKSPERIIGDLVDVVSKNGVLLLNVGPRADGTIPEEEKSILLSIGEWLSRNGEAIYGTRPWTVYGEGPTKIITGTFNDTKRSPFTHEDIRFTTRGTTLYAIVLGRPENGRLVIRSLAENSHLYPGGIASVNLLGCEQTIQWQRAAEGLIVTLPEEEANTFGLSLRITGEEDK